MSATETRPGMRVRDTVTTHFALTAFSGLVAAFIFVGMPQIDILVARQFLLHNGAFVFNNPGFGQELRLIFNVVFAAAALVIVTGLAGAAFSRRRPLSMTMPEWLYLALCLGLGPGLLANLVLKEHWGRARPFHIEAFGGEQTFTPALMLSDQCNSNCSFVAGEAASMYMLFFAAAFLAASRYRATLLWCGTVSGLTAGGIRMAQGGHFLSDVVFSGVLMAMVAQAVYWIVFEAGRDTLAEDGPVHGWLVARRNNAAALMVDARDAVEGLVHATAVLASRRRLPGLQRQAAFGSDGGMAILSYWIRT